MSCVVKTTAATGIVTCTQGWACKFTVYKYLANSLRAVIHVHVQGISNNYPILCATGHWIREQYTVGQGQSCPLEKCSFLPPDPGRPGDPATSQILTVHYAGDMTSHLKLLAQSTLIYANPLGSGNLVGITNFRISEYRNQKKTYIVGPGKVCSVKEDSDECSSDKWGLTTYSKACIPHRFH